ncbi:DapH/DapD/GlmU-related protein [Sellimonas catena]|uniref:Acetyltransferase n=1 Tax=Sellimonas catena TaxID=2994035 RepID=A0A9W6CI91_9FIRM|nr:DapH/DapD/GlmU-related protein [Sellimonas catena]GLG91694.1 hypothetical protein Selli2_31210 [Sellimonas catena]
MGKLKSFLYRLRGEVSTEDLIKLGLTIGQNFRRNEHCIIDQSHCWLIEIGDNVTLAPRVHILAHDASMWYECAYTKIAPVHIGNNVFIGAGSIIMPGVSIGNNCIIGAGSVVTHDVDSGTVVAGNPAKKVKDYSDFIAKHKKHMENKPCFEEEYTLRNPNFSDSQKKEQKQVVKANKFGYVR